MNYNNLYRQILTITSLVPHENTHTVAAQTHHSRMFCDSVFFPLKSVREMEHRRKLLSTYSTITCNITTTNLRSRCAFHTRLRSSNRKKSNWHRIQIPHGDRTKKGINIYLCCAVVRTAPRQWGMKASSRAEFIEFLFR